MADGKQYLAGASKGRVTARRFFRVMKGPERQGLRHHTVMLRA